MDYFLWQRIMQAISDELDQVRLIKVGNIATEIPGLMDVVGVAVILHGKKTMAGSWTAAGPAALI